MKDMTDGEIKRKIAKFEKDIDRLQVVEAELLDIREGIKTEIEGDFKNPIKDMLGLYRAEAKANSAVKAVGDLLGSLTATNRALSHAPGSPQMGLYEEPATAKPAPKKPKKKSGGSKKVPTAKKTNK
jgi:hypothetical protein